MGFFRSKRIEIKFFVFWLTFFMVSQGVVALAGSDRLYPTNKVTLYRDDNVVGIYTKEVPLPEGSVISTDGRCAIKLDDFYLVAEDQSVFSISTSERQRNLFIKEGTIYFKTSEMKRTFSFNTPDGQIVVQRIQLNAAIGDGTIKGYVTVTKNQSEMGIAEGGSMEVFTDQGLMTIQSGKKIILAQADMDIGIPEDAAPEPAAQQAPEPAKRGWSTTTRNVAIGALGVAAVAGIALGLSGGGGGDDGGSVSPSSP